MAPPHAQLAFQPGFERSPWPRRLRVVLACCHLDHDPANNAASNLVALGQHCQPENDPADNPALRCAGARRRRIAGSVALPILQDAAARRFPARAFASPAPDRIGLP